MSPSKLSIDYDGPQASSILSKSASQWQGALHEAMTMSLLPENCYQLGRLLHRIPKLPDDIPSDSTFIEGHSTWKSHDTSCRLDSKTEKSHKFRLGRRYPTICRISPSNNFQIWEGNPNNGLALLVLGWAYVMSAGLAKRQHLSLRYEPLERPSGSVQITLDYASSREIRWWKALSVRGSGFSIAAKHLYSPWAVLVNDLDLEIIGEIEDIHQPPSASEAVQYIERLCNAYDLGSQCCAALSAALSLPLHSSVDPLSSAIIELPRPKLLQSFKPPRRGQYFVDPETLDRLITFSLSPAYIGSTLWSVFSNLDVPCNFAGAWLGPISEVLCPILQKNNLELLVKVLSFTSAAPLWIGVALCGQNKIIKSIGPFLKTLIPYPHTQPSIDAAAWTGIPHSFMDSHPPGPYLQDGKISRANVWRLRHDLHANYTDGSFSTTPPHGWPPFGTMRYKDTEIELHEHLHCSHQWEYGFWTWDPMGTTDSGFFTVKKDFGPLPQPPDPRSVGDTNISCGNINFKVSQTATKRIFTWCSSQVERNFGCSIVDFHQSMDDDGVDPDSHQQTPTAKRFVEYNNLCTRIDGWREVVQVATAENRIDDI